jgi:Ca-activated chloride channel family protein
MMSKKRNIVIYTIVIAIIATGLAALVWGRTWRTARVNRLLVKGQSDQALTGYQRLLAGAPDSAVLLNNLGLCLYRQGKYDAAAGYFRKALKSASGRPAQAGRSGLFNPIHYHLGNSLFKQAAASRPDQAYNRFTEALSAYRQAIEADRSDRDAKYNYELTRLRADQARQQQQQEQNKQDKQDKQGSRNKQDRKNQPEKPDGQNGPEERPNQAQNRKNPTKRQPDPAQQSGQSGKNNPTPGMMSKAEAEALLKAAENGDQYQGRVLGADAPAGAKDW